MISVIVTAYNEEKYIGQCIESIIKQTYKDIEIIVVDDGSTDSSGKICDDFQKHDSRITVIHKNNEGLVAARKTGLREAKGEYIAYVDSDDWIDSQMYEALFMQIKKYDAEMVCSSYIEERNSIELQRDNKPADGLYADEKLKALSEIMLSDEFGEYGVLSAIWCKLYNKKLLEKSQYEVPDNITIGEDVACVYNCIIEAKRVVICNRAFYHYRIHDKSMMNDKNEYVIDKISILNDYLRHSLGKSGISNINSQIDRYVYARYCNAIKNEKHITSVPIMKPYIFPF